MKNINKIIAVFVLVLSFSCEKDENENVYSGDSFISFGADTSSITIENKTTPTTITAYASVPNIESDITVNFEITNENSSSSNYTVVDGKSSFTFGKDKYTDTIQILPIDNNDEDGNKILKISLTSSSGGETLGFPGPDANGKVYTLTIEDNDCPYTLEELGEATWTGTDNVPDAQKGPNASQITTSFDGTDLLLEGIAYAWLTDADYWNEPVVTSNKVIVKIDPVTYALTIDEQPLCTTTYKGEIQAPYSIKATGDYSSCSKRMTINYDLIQKGKVLRAFTETITMQ